MPEELWIEILQDLPRETLQNVALSHRTLRRISRPFLFITFVFHPYAVPHIPRNVDCVRWPEADEPLLFSQEVQDRELERLNFWSSSEIAPLVRTCRLIPVLGGGAWGAENEPDVATALLAAFFERLPRFTSIQYFHAYMVRFTQTGLVNLCLLPALSRLEIVLGMMVEPIDCSSLHLGRVTSFRLQHARHSSPNVVDSWMRFLSNQRVEMYLGFGPRLFADTARNIPPFPHALRVGDRLRPLNASPVLPILSKFMGVEVFVMEGSWSVSDHVPSGFSHFLPMLKEYAGPQDMLPILMSRPTLSHITVDWISWPWTMETLRASQPFNGVVSLTANSSRMNSTEFRFLFKIFPFLSVLSLNVAHAQRDSPNLLRKAFLENITIISTSLEFLSIRWKHSEAEDSSSSDSEDHASTSDDGTGKSRHIVELRALVARCPALTSVWIENHDFLFRWHRLSDGTVDEPTVLDAGEFINRASLG
ncbi:hypothetical protein MVEN_01607300 [Mycena venus]|uniref:F-box domain-containing protein n=1 Tax=Mycena venus TaxID=2733690 RepID=A0A8H6XQ00_9AGAR|nr:hypothetical protein MVEN_01607300 [Mycena venus]